MRTILVGLRGWARNAHHGSFELKLVDLGLSVTVGALGVATWLMF